MKYRAAIFDMDGTILDTLEDLTASTNHALKAGGLPARTTDEVRRFVGNGVGRLIELAVPDGCPAGLLGKVHDDFIHDYAAHCADHTKPYDGIPDLLRTLRSLGVKTAVLSNKADFAVRELSEKYFAGLFDVAVGEREGIRRKPAPDAVNEIIRSFGCARGECVYIGDSDVDIQTAKNAGIDCIGAAWGFRGRDFLKACGAEKIAGSAAELSAMLCP